MKKIVTEIEKILENEYGNGKSKAQEEEQDLARLLAKLGSKEVEKDEKIIGIDSDGTLILPDEPPKQKPIVKVYIRIYV